MKKPEITLTGPEILQAAYAGVMRHAESIKNGRKDGQEYNGEHPWQIHIEGAMGEMALAKYFGIYWSSSVRHFKGPDLGENIQVRTRSKHHYDLLVRPGDKDEHRFYHVTGRCPTYVIRGSMLAKDAKQERWFKKYGYQPKAYFVPEEYLDKPGEHLND